MHDSEQLIKVVIDHVLEYLPLLMFHSNTNLAIVLFTWDDLMKILKEFQHEPDIISFTP